MNCSFIHDDFLLETESGRNLYHQYAKDLPIYDYHSHLPPDEISENTRWENLAQIWLGEDHYKWRAMRSNGIPEKFLTGDAPDYEKYLKWAETVPETLKNPLYHWTHSELKRYFDVDELLNPASAKRIWDHCNEKLKEDYFSSRGLMEKSKVKLVCTTDDPVDDLSHHIEIAKLQGFGSTVLPTWRPDKAMAVDNTQLFNNYLDQLAEVADVEISTYEDLRAAVKIRHDFFASVGCKLSDHGLDTAYGDAYTESEIQKIFSKVRSGNDLEESEISKFKTAMMIYFAELDYDAGWTQQMHIGPMRNNNRRLFKSVGPDIGCDSMDDKPIAQGLSNFLGELDERGKLPRTILYNLNPRDNALFAAMIGNFQDDSCAGKIQWGSGWWFQDTKQGMENQMECLSELGLLSRFVGMLTDSRSFLSFTRHEYFRRILCNILGNDIDKGIVPNDEELIGRMVKNICYYNAKNYFDIELK